MKRWFYIDITTTCHERVAVKAEDEEQAKDIAGILVDTGTINPARAAEYAHGSVNDSITIAERKFKRPPKSMRKFEWVHSARAAEE